MITQRMKLNSKQEQESRERGSEMQRSEENGKGVRGNI